MTGYSLIINDKTTVDSEKERRQMEANTMGNIINNTPNQSRHLLWIWSLPLRESLRQQIRPANSTSHVRTRIASLHINHQLLPPELPSTLAILAHLERLAKIGNAQLDILRLRRKLPTRRSKTVNFFQIARTRGAPFDIQRCHSVVMVQTALLLTASLRMLRRCANSIPV